jgi:hypothetical protein
MYSAGHGLLPTTQSHPKPPPLTALKNNPSPSQTVNAARLDRNALKSNYLSCLHARSKATFRQTVVALLHLGVTRDTLLAWAVAAGHNHKYIAKLLSECLCGLGLRLRRAGAGRRPSSAALLLLAFAREMFGERRSSVLRAAWRASNARSAAGLARDAQDLAGITEVGLPATNAPGLLSRPAVTNGAALFQVGSGSYMFNVSF